MALVNWVYGANWTDRKLDTDFYLIKDGVVNSAYSLTVFGSPDSYGTSGGLYFITDNESGVSGLSAGINLTSIKSIELTVKNTYGNVNYSGLIGIYNSTAFTSPIAVISNIINTTLQTLTIDVSASTFDGVKQLLLAVNNATSEVTETFYIKDIILKQ